MNKITITLTEDQAKKTIYALQQELDSNYSDNEYINAFTIRIIDKIKAELIK